MPVETSAFVTNYSKSMNSKAEINYRQTISSAVRLIFTLRQDFILSSLILLYCS